MFKINTMSNVIPLIELSFHMHPHPRHWQGGTLSQQAKITSINNKGIISVISQYIKHSKKQNAIKSHS